MTQAAAFQAPRAGGRVALPWLVAAAIASVSLWIAVERITEAPIHPRYAEMLVAARTLQAASQVLLAQKKTRGLDQPATIDPNHTGMIGEEYTPITTTMGDLASKRTTTNPDFAAGLVRLIDTLGLPRGTPVAIVLSGSFVGGNIAAIAAAEALGLRPVIITSLGASQWGANDPEFDFLDMVEALHQRGVINSGVLAAVYGGERSVGNGMDPAAIAALRASAERAGVPMVDATPLSAIIDDLMARISAAVGQGPKLGAVINVGGALIGLGNCLESYDFPHGVIKRAPTACTGGTPGIVMRLAEQGLPVLQVLNIRQIAVELGLPIDPVPLPTPGNNTAIYGSLKRG